jgi:hypothetical protein
MMPAAAERQARPAQPAMPLPAKHRGCRLGLQPHSTRRAGAISAPKWSREFEDPIVLPEGRKLVTLRDAATYITKLPKAEQDLEIWQIAVEHLIGGAETGGGWLMLARIGVLKALHRDRERVFNPRPQRHALRKAEAEAGSGRGPEPAAFWKVGAPIVNQFTFTRLGACYSKLLLL